MSNATTASTDLQGMNVFDYIRSMALVVMFIAMTFQDRRTWLLADTIGCIAMGAFHVIYPHIFIKQFIAENDLDNLQCHIVRVFASFLLANGVYRVLVRKSRDEAVISSLVWSRIWSLSLMTLFGFYLRSTSKFYMQRADCTFVLFGIVVWLVSTLFQLVRYVSPLGGVEKSGTITLILRTEAFICFILGLAHLAFPGWLLGFQVRQAKILHRFLVRLVGTTVIGTAVDAQQAVSFRYDADKKSFFIYRVLTFILGGLCMIYDYMYEDVFSSKEMRMPGLSLVLVAPSVVGLVLLLTGAGKSQKADRYSASYSSSYYTRSKTSY